MITKFLYMLEITPPFCCLIICFRTRRNIECRILICLIWKHWIGILNWDSSVRPDGFENTTMHHTSITDVIYRRGYLTSVAS